MWQIVVLRGKKADPSRDRDLKLSWAHRVALIHTDTNLGLQTL